VERLRALGLDHLRVGLRPGEGEPFLLALGLARVLKTDLHVALTLPADPGPVLDRMADVLSESSEPPVAAWLVLGEAAKVTPRTVADRAAGALRPFGGRVGVGTDFYFTELNRNRPAGPADFVAYSINPQVHATDDRSIMESLEAIADTLRTARTFLPEGTPIHVGPVTLRTRRNPNATAADESPDPDPRQSSPFAAAWTVGCLAELSRGRADMATFYETIGPRGVMDAGGVFPVYHVFAALAGLGGKPVELLDADDPLTAGGLVCGRFGLVANYTDRAQVVRLPDDFRLGDVELGPYAVFVLGEGAR
jgi:hypothetical protein